ncbi:hypothetical protein FOZ60_002882 [Perkinsus olseni]|uniref:Uncharacterized protein n=1 Tax=Perkinsus olseni TaxID=32597 RepID=A0A7J6Q787_PEROL|nr:hypothetical protein FOZ60_002882 [Perkinsus olseni]KAF4704117.1 hypothetical protein FOZ62_022704 [Perkinsus olseni]
MNLVSGWHQTRATTVLSQMLTYTACLQSHPVVLSETQCSAVSLEAHSNRCSLPQLRELLPNYGPVSSSMRLPAMSLLITQPPDGVFATFV